MHTIKEDFYRGHCINAYHYYGAHLEKNGTRFNVYAPNAKAIEIIGDFNNWQGENHMMEKIDDKTFTLFIPNAKKNMRYRYRVFAHNGNFVDKSDPFAFYSEVRPNSASVIYDLDFNEWSDSDWMNSRSSDLKNAINIYELHFGSWRKADDTFYTYKELAKILVKHLKQFNFNYVEILPLNEHPFDGSWGYQAHGYYSITSRYGTPEEFQYFVNYLHKHNIGVILDFVPTHFVKDAYGLAYFDSTPTFEYDKYHDANSEWDTLNFNLWKEEVRSFLISSACFFLDIYHIDGLRMDAVKNAIYWNGNKNRGVNQGALDFIKRLNYSVHKNFPNILMFAEDSSDYPLVCAKVEDGGLGFDYKWDLGWMNDTLAYLAIDPIARQYHHHKLTFSMMYFYNEKFILPFSHDEVVHGKKSILEKIWGTYEQRFAQLKALYVYQYTHPGKKLNFMGNEIAHVREWDEKIEMDWFLLKYPIHDSFQHFFQKLTNLYITKEALHRYDFDGLGFKWIDADNAGQNLFLYERKAENSTMIIVLNFSGNYYHKQKIGVEFEGSYREILNTEDTKFSGQGTTNPLWTKTIAEECNFLPYQIQINIAPFSAIILEKKHRRI